MNYHLITYALTQQIISILKIDSQSVPLKSFEVAISLALSLSFQNLC